jgi:hypothetical protein
LFEVFHQVGHGIVVVVVRIRLALPTQAHGLQTGRTHTTHTHTTPRRP